MGRRVKLLIVLFSASAAAGCVRRPAEAAPGPQGDAAPAAPRNYPVGNAGCSAAACHGNPDPAALTARPPDDSLWRTSATVFYALDPHRNAYAALTSPLGREIARKLNAGIPADRDERCLACHTNPSLAGPTEYTDLRSDGVSCESCHGNAARWRAEHTEGFKHLSADSQEALGFRAGVRLSRAAVCAGCHVGSPSDGDSPTRDMNHDMIAAGHPALRTDYPDLMKALPPHWRPQSPEPYPPGETAFAGALKALHGDRDSRHKGHDPRTPWPELADPLLDVPGVLPKDLFALAPWWVRAERNCRACHQELTARR